jgi:hypothetical protein
MKLNWPYDEMYVLDNLISFDYVQIISMLFKNWCMSEKCWIVLKCLSVCCGWNLNYANSMRTCHVEIVYVLWRNYDLNDFKVFDEMLDLFSFKGTWFSNSMIL